MVSKRSDGRILLLLIVLSAGAMGPVTLGAEQPPRAAQPAQEEFVPIDQLPPDEKLPAARFLIAAYSVAWVVVAAYLWSIRQRLGRVEREIADVSRRVARGGPVAPAPPGADR